MLASQKTGRAKLDHVSSILAELKADLSASKLSTSPRTERKQLLEQLKVYGRSVDNADPIFTQDGIGTLGQYAFSGETTAASQEALRCLANALLLVPRTRQILVDLGHGPSASDMLKGDSIDNEFLLSRILFLTTYNTTLDYPFLVQSHALAANINAAISRHAARYTHNPRQPAQEHTQPMDLMALSETLKLLFNITHFHPDLIAQFSPSIPNLFTILVRRGVTKPPLEAPASFLINALLNLDLDNTNPETSSSRANQDANPENPVFPSASPTANTTHLITLLSASLTSYTDTDLDTTVAPLLTLIRRIYELAPTAVQKSMEQQILPTPAERDKPLGKSETLPSRLLNLTTNALTPTLRGSISSMLFELSHKDAATFVQNVGYGFASGFLMSNNIPMPEEVMRAHDPSGADGAQGAGVGIPVNPITGQRLDKEEVVDETPMTQEEKEREAERLFVLFERLKATGVMDVVNPVEAAYREGRIQELSDDEA
ncbi:hypothetical protein T440DRAFT_487726 [Plenodomus tracheiphilus IPT5]|uniref:Guanine nucleotide exchange factor n=1 Tax=Plenodomus tracheiphilus IPT5 TaxID=1408161 RepID=A0A6A7BFM0_9PLEO|nr:hypothetical protein T440DRAFT_487726 [Plenodomus tracheiphilus IPT5]